MPHPERRRAERLLAAPALLFALAVPVGAHAQAAPQLPAPPVIQPPAQPVTGASGGPSGGAAPPMAAPKVLEPTGSAPAMSRPEILGPDDKPLTAKSAHKPNPSTHKSKEHHPATSPNHTKVFQPS